MLQGILVGAQVLVLVGIACLLWQIWRRFPDQENASLDEKRVEEVQRRLTILSICAVVETVLIIASAVLRFVETLS